MSTILHSLYAAIAALLPLLTILFEHDSWTRAISSSSFIPQLLSYAARDSIDASTTAAREPELDFSFNFNLLADESVRDIMTEYLAQSNAGYCSHPIIETSRTLWHPFATILGDEPILCICAMLLACSLGLWGMAHSRDVSWEATCKHLVRHSESELRILGVSPQRLCQSSSRDWRRTISYKASSSSYITLACNHALVSPRNYYPVIFSRSMRRDLLTTDTFSVDMPGSFHPRAKSNLDYFSQSLAADPSGLPVPILLSATEALSADPDTASFEVATIKSLFSTDVQNKSETASCYATDHQDLNTDVSASKPIGNNAVNLNAGGKIVVIPNSESILSSSSGSDFNVSAASSLSVDLVRRAFDLPPATRPGITTSRIYFEDPPSITSASIKQLADHPNMEPQRSSTTFIIRAKT